MTSFLDRLRQRKLVQWALAYVAGAWAVLQVIDLAAQNYSWPRLVMHVAFGIVLLGFLVTLVLAWYHGERGVQRVTGTELLIVALLLAIGGGFLWYVGRPATHGARQVAAMTKSPPKATATPESMHVPDTAPVAPSTTIPAKSIAVLPFENLSTDKANAYFADGIQDLILTKLADIGDLAVISRTSTMQYGSHPENLQKVGEQLRVATILEGSVQKAGDQVLINVQLIDARTDHHVWAQSYQRTLKNIFGVEGEVAGKVADELKAKLIPSETAAVASVPTRNPKAYNLYLKAQYALDQVSMDGQPAHYFSAERDLKQAIAQDPKFAAAYTLLGRVQIDMIDGAVEGTDASLANAEAYARKALALQPDLAEGHYVLGRVFLAQSSPQKGLQELQTAVRLKPGNADFKTVLAMASSSFSGDWQHALKRLSKAQRLDPRNVRNYFSAAYLHVKLRQYEAARQTLQRGLAIRPDSQLLREEMGRVMMQMGNPAGARTAVASLPDHARMVPGLRFTSWMYSRNYANALKAAERVPVRKIYADAGSREYMIGIAAKLSGDSARADKVFAQARRAIESAMREHPDSSYLRFGLANVDMWSGHRKAAMQGIEMLIHEDNARYEKMQRALHSAGHSTQRGPDAMTPVAYSAEPYELRAEVLAHFGDAKGATRQLEQLFETPGTGAAISAADLRLDPVWDPIRKTPAFQALLEKYPWTPPKAATEPASAYTTGGA